MDKKSSNNDKKYRYSASGKERSQKIIVFEKGVRFEEWGDMLSDCKGHILKKLPLINAAVILVDEEEYQKVCSISGTRVGIVRIDEDIELESSPVITEEKQRAKVNMSGIPWTLSMIEGYNTGLTGAGIKIGIIDTGVDARHPMIKNKIKKISLAEETFISSADDNGHGTHVTGVICAERSNYGVIGIAPEAEIYSFKALDEEGTGRLSDLIEGLNWCLENKIRLVNLSLSAKKENQTFRYIIQEARSAGLIMICASGNYGPAANTITYPAKFSETIAVAACDENLNIASFSGRGKEVDVCAPGVNIKSTWPGWRFKVMSGTSMASPHVTGLAALMLQNDPDLSASDIKSIIQSTATQLPNISRDEQGAGIINVNRALARVRKRIEFKEAFDNV